MVNEITRSGLIVAQSARTSPLLAELISLCDWPVVRRPTIRSLFHPGLFDPAIRSFTEVIDLRSGRLLLIVGIGLMLIVATGQLTVRRLD